MTGGFSLEMGGELVIADTLTVSGHVLLTLSLAGANPMLELDRQRHDRPGPDRQR